MVTTKTIQLFEYSELSPEAKEKARDWWLSVMDASDFDSVVEDFCEVAARLGVEIATRHQQTMGGTSRPFPCVYWSLAYSQSDYAAFEGRYAYKKGAAKEVREYAPGDTALHAIADALQAAQAKAFYKATAIISERRDSITVEVEGAPYEREPFERWTANIEEPIKEAMRDLCRWLYDRLREQNDYLSSEEQVAESIEANEYTFRLDGTREDA